VSGEFGDLPTGVIAQPDPVILPRADRLFATRASRLRHLSEGHPMADWLRFMAGLADAQQDAVAAVVAPAIAILAHTPPLDCPAHRRDPSWRRALARILLEPDDPALPDQTRQVMAALRGRDPEPLAAAWLAGVVPATEAGPAMFVAAALQVYFAAVAATLPVGDIALLAQRGLCPVCGSAPVAGVITGAGKAPGTRYLHCGLCATAWNHVRVACIGCGESKSLTLQEIEGGNGAVMAETCDACMGYAKMLYQAKDMQVDPMADDLASLGLDILVGEAGWSRLAANPLVLAG